jgi:hypothetical protein
MKTILTIAVSAAALVIAAVANAFALDLANLLCIGVASGIAGMFASDYSSSPTYNLEPAKLVTSRKKTSDAGVEFATMATFHSMIG